MRYITDRSRAHGLGSAKEGSDHWWSQRVTAVALVPLGLLFVFPFAMTVGEGNKERIAFVGAGEGVMFVTSAPQYSQGPGLVTYVLRGEIVDGEKLLTLRYAAFDPGNEEFVLPDRNERIVLAQDFATVRFRYYGAPTEDDIVEWLDAWPEDAEFYPRAIHVRTSGEEETDGWPDFVFELRSGGAS